MAAFLVGCPTAANVLVALDDPSVWEDEGAPYIAFALTNPIDWRNASTMGRFRNIVQMVTANAPATITLTPYGDGDEYPSQAVMAAFDPARGTTQPIELEPAVDGHRFQYKMEATTFGGPVAFGEADLQFIAKRSGI